MRYWAPLLLVIAAPTLARGQEFPRLPADTRFVVRYRQAEFAKTEWLKRDAEAYKPLLTALVEPLVTLAVDPIKVEHIWLALGESYPRGSLLVVQGGIEPAKVDSRLQQFVRDRKYSAKTYRENNLPFYSLEIPVVSNPIPGFPSMVFIGNDAENRLMAALDKETLLAALAKASAATWPAALEPLKGQRDVPAGLTLLFAPPAALTEPTALLAGVTMMSVTVQPADGFKWQASMTATDANALAERTRAGIEQVRQLFPPLAQQQGVNPKIARFVMELLEAAKTDVAGGQVKVTTDIPAVSLKVIVTK